MPQEVFGMIDSHELKKRDIYLKKLIGFQDTEPGQGDNWHSPLRQVQSAETQPSGV